MTLRAACFALIAFVGLTGYLPSQASEKLSVEAKLLAKYRACVVMLSYTISVEERGSETVSRIAAESEGTLVSADGLLIVPASVINPMDLYGKLLQSRTGEAPPAVNSADFFVRIPGSDEPLRAKVVTQDRDLGIAWLKIEKPPAPMAYVDLSIARDPKVGQNAYVIGMIAEEFDYAAFVERAHITGEIRIPYAAFIADQSQKMVFSNTGVPLGFSVMRIEPRNSISTGAEYQSYATLVGGERLKNLHQRVLAKSQ